MSRFLFACTFLILVVGLAVFGQGVGEGRKFSFSGPTPDSPSPVALPSSFPSDASADSGSEGEDLAQASRHYLRGELDAAIQIYKAVLQENPKSPEAYAGLIRAYFGQKNVEQAYETATSALKVTDAPVVHVALGDVYYRQGKITEAEQEWMCVVNKGAPSARAYWGLSQARAARSLYQQAKEMLDKAYELDPQDPDISNRWIRSLSRTKQIQFWENYLAARTNDDDEIRATIQHRLDYLRAVQSRPHHSCRLVSHVPTAEIKLAKFSRHPILHGYGLEASLNGKKGTLLLDTGATGILIGEEWARQAGITKISEAEFGGIGDEGVGIGYSGFASSVKIGELEFQGCRVRVNEKGLVSGGGIVGTDMFSAFLVDIDFPDQKLRLEPLPKRPHENATDVTIVTETEGPGYSDDQSSGEKAAADARPSQSTRRGPRDRYIAPEMQAYTQVYRFGHFLLIPTRIGDSALRLFALDTGGSGSLLDIRSSPNLMSMVPPQESTQLRNYNFLGINGPFAVYNTDNVVLQFGRLRPENHNVFNCDLSHLSDQVGTEISGILGIDALHLLTIRIDYRDGLVDFVEKP
jgi:tetratricopeptide (TPR) repeat protein